VLGEAGDIEVVDELDVWLDDKKDVTVLLCAVVVDVTVTKL
jgi:hypothetical protein